MKIFAAQVNPTVGNIEGNLDKLRHSVMQAEKEKADIAVFPELFITGYPPRDLLSKKWFVQKVLSAIKDIESFSENLNVAMLLGAPLPTEKSTGLGLFNSAVLIRAGKKIFVQHKSLLPTYDVFDEARYFDSAEEVKIFKFKGYNLGITVCEDAWNDKELWSKRFYDFDPVEELAKQGADLIINISASPFFTGKEKLRYKIIKNHVIKHNISFLFLNQVGGNDELVFDGRSIFLNAKGNVVSCFPSFEEHCALIEIKNNNIAEYSPEEEIETMFKALVLGVKDYLYKCGFKKAVVGLSGGIDSAVTAAVAVNALGSENVLGILMPSEYSSKGSIDDSVKLAENLGIKFEIIPIKKIFSEYLDTLAPYFAGKSRDITEENIQARIRGNILMAFSNKFGALVLSTGNKSELAVGYCTLYGDMSGGLAVISDVPKTTVYKLAEFMNRDKIIIPEEIIKKAPSAELRPNQKDEDSLPPYPVLDKILHCYIEEGMSEDEIVGVGFERETVKWVIKTVNRNEYKRKQAAPGLKVTSKAFGMGRRMPVAAKY
jgi:NAD+ synthase (glutamine-hydrolysing)